jgi:O-antigen/teichoic acid export membrane protein
VLAFQFIIAAFEIIPVAHLERNLDFKSKSLVSLGASVAGGVLTLFLALADYGVWALIWGNMLVLFLQTVGFNIISPFLHLPIFSLKNMREIASFGGLVTTERAMWFFYTQADIFIVGKLLGKDQLGIYSVAMHLASLIMHKTGGIIYEIAFPSFARANEEPDKVPVYFLKAVRIMSFVTFPLFLGMSSVAPELVAVLLGDTWIMVGDVMAILCLVMPLRMLANLFPPLLQGIGRPDTSVINLLMAVIVMPAAFLVGTLWGIIGVSIAWAIAYPVVFTVMLARSVPLIGISIKQSVMAAAMPALVSIVMYITVIVSKSVMSVEADVVRLIVSITIGASIYTMLSHYLCRQGFREVFELVRR